MTLHATLWGRNKKWSTICRHLQIHFDDLKLLYLDSNGSEVNFQGSLWPWYHPGICHHNGCHRLPGVICIIFCLLICITRPGGQTVSVLYFEGKQYQLSMLCGLLVPRRFPSVCSFVYKRWSRNDISKPLVCCCEFQWFVCGDSRVEAVPTCLPGF